MRTAHAPIFHAERIRAMTVETLRHRTCPLDCVVRTEREAAAGTKSPS